VPAAALRAELASQLATGGAGVDAVYKALRTQMEWLGYPPAVIVRSLTELVDVPKLLSA